MKRLLTLSLLAAAVCAAPAWAHEDRPGPGPDGPGMQEGPGGPGGEMGMGAGAPETMKEALGLSADQVKKLKALGAERKDMKELRRQLRDKRQALRDLVEDKADEGKLGAALQDLEATQAKMMDEMKKLKSERDAVLTVTQRAKLAVHQGMGLRGRGPRDGKGMGLRDGKGPRGGQDRDGKGAPDERDEREHGDD